MDPFFSSKRFTSYQGDAETVLRKFAANSADCVVTSPPYFTLQRNLAGPGEIDHEATVEAYVGRLSRVGRELTRVVKRRGSFWLILGDTRRGKDWLGIPWAVAFAMMDAEWRLRDAVIWSRTAASGAARDRLASAYEMVFHFVLSADAHYDTAALLPPPGSPRSKIKRSSGLSDIWVVPLEETTFRDFAVVPEALVERAILATSPPRGTVLDPFLGSGTSAAVALRLGRSALGIDLSPESLRFSQQRVRKFLREPRRRSQ